MGVWDYISSTANVVNQNALIPLWNLSSTSYSYCRSATSNVIAAVPKLSTVDEDARSNATQFATACAKNAAVFACREGLKTIPGGGPFYDIVSRSFRDTQKKDQHKKPELRTLNRAIEDHEKQIKEMNDLVRKMKEEINTLKQAVNEIEADDQDRLREASEIHATTIRYLMTKSLHSNADKQPLNSIQNMMAMGFLTRYNFDSLGMPEKQYPESS